MAITAHTLVLIEEARRALDALADGPTRSLTAAWVRAWDALADEFGAALDELIALGGASWPTRSQIDRAARTGAALELTARALDRLADQARNEITAAARQAAHAAAAAQERLAVSQLPAAAQAGAASRAPIPAPAAPSRLPDGTQVRFRRADEEQLAQMINRTAQQIHAATRPLTPTMVDGMKRELVRGITLGNNPRTVARDMMRRLHGQFAGGLSRALNIAHTEILDAYRGAARLSQMANADVLNGWRWHATLSNRTCFVCWSMHGTEHPVDEPGPLDHPSGRCTRIPIVRSWEDLGFKVPEPPSIIPNARAVFDALPRADKLRIMGPTRLAMLERGDIDFGDLARARSNPGWRHSYAPVPVADLAAAG